MRKKITIPTVVHDYWQQYGSLSDVVNKLLTEVDLINTPAMDLGSYDTTTTVTIDVTNEDYLLMCDMMGSHNNKLSIARMLTFLYNTAYAETHDWQIVTPDVQLRRNVYSQVLRQLSLLLYSSKNTTISTGLQQILAHLTDVMKEDLPHA